LNSLNFSKCNRGPCERQTYEKLDENERELLHHIALNRIEEPKHLIIKSKQNVRIWIYYGETEEIDLYFYLWRIWIYYYEETEEIDLYIFLFLDGEFGFNIIAFIIIMERQKRFLFKENLDLIMEWRRD